MKKLHSCSREIAKKYELKITGAENYRGRETFCTN